MKHLTKLSLIAIAASLLGSGVSLADDPQLQNRLAIQRAQAAKTQRTTTIAVYGRTGVGYRERMEAPARETRFELRTNAHGQTFGVWVPVK